MSDNKKKRPSILYLVTNADDEILGLKLIDMLADPQQYDQSSVVNLPFEEEKPHVSGKKLEEITLNLRDLWLEGNYTVGIKIKEEIQAVGADLYVELVFNHNENHDLSDDGVHMQIGLPPSGQNIQISDPNVKIVKNAYSFTNICNQIDIPCMIVVIHNDLKTPLKEQFEKKIEVLRSAMIQLLDFEQTTRS